ncbi:MAG: NAD(P)H-hydrate epimerase [Gemmataceae bacterium]
MPENRYLSRAAVRDVDRRAIEEFGVPGIVLMENAGRGASELLVRLGIQGSVAILCGKGNNGGDGFVIARHLDNRGIPVQVLLVADPGSVTGDAATNLAIVQKAGLPLDVRSDGRVTADELAQYDWIVDALFGTGLHGAVRPPFDKVIDAINQSGSKVLAVDIPSGLDCDTGAAPGPTVRAAHTATFVASKQGFARPAARQFTGEVHVIDIGAPRAACGG